MRNLLLVAGLYVAMACGSWIAGTGPAIVIRQKQVGVSVDVNTITLPDTPLANTSPMLVRNGSVQREGLDYLISGAEITLRFPELWDSGDTILCVYFY